MVVRYPHTGVISIQAVTITAGEYASSSATTLTIQGRLEIPQPNSPPKRAKTASGDWLEAKGRFFTKEKKVTGADSITVDGVSYKIVSWVSYQTYSEIWLD